MKTELRYSWPSAEGVNPEYIVNFLNACEKADSEIHGIMIARHGNVIFEAYNAPYAAEIPHIMHSFTKTLTNTAVALAYDDGLLDLDNPILKYFPEYEPEANEYLKKCTIRNMITMRNGQERSVGGNEWRPLKTSWKDAYLKYRLIRTWENIHVFQRKQLHFVLYRAKTYRKDMPGTCSGESRKGDRSDRLSMDAQPGRCLLGGKRSFTHNRGHAPNRTALPE